MALNWKMQVNMVARLSKQQVRMATWKLSESC